MRPASFFVVRSPLLGAASGPSPPDLVRDPIVREALERASPSLVEALDGRRPSRGDVWPSVTRYLERMRGRCTPFSLMSGYAFGTTGGASTAVRVVARADYQRVVRLDVDAVGRLVAEHAKRNPAETLWVAAGGIAHFPDILRVASRSGDGDQVRLTDVARSKAVDCVLAAASSPSSFSALVDALMGLASARADAEKFVTTVIEERLLVPSHAPPVLVVDELAVLSSLGADMARFASGARGARTTRLGDPGRLEAFTGVEAIDEKDLIFDLVKPTEAATLGDDAIAAVRDVLAVMPRLTPAAPKDARLEEFCLKFASRFEGREVPLADAVDPRRGLPFPVWPQSPARSFNQDLEAWIVTLFERSCRERSELELEDAEIPKLARWTFPESFAVGFSLAERPLQLWDVMLMRAPGTPLFARATAVLPGAFRERAMAFLAEVAAREPGVDFADIAYFVPGRSAAFTQYPLLQPREITLTPTSGDPSKSLDPNDLLVSVSGGAVHLRSAATSRPVRIRTTSAANPDRLDTTDLYRFLSAVAHQGDATCSAWWWGAVAAAAHLPRVTFHGHVLSPAQWNLDPSRTEPLRKSKTKQDRWDAAQRLRAELTLPRHLRFHERHDHLLPVDLEDPFSVEAWLDIAQEKMHLHEAFPVERSAVTGPEGPYHHQVVLPMIGEPPKPPSPPRRSTPVLARDVVLDRVIPGGPLLFLSFWGDADELLAILRDLVEEVVRPMEADGSVTHWFFLPFTDPDPHVRVRLFGDASRLWSAGTLAAIAARLDPLVRQGVLKMVSYDTYDRETYRYGGPAGMALAERVFHLSSEMALRLHERHVFDVESDAELEEVIVPLVVSQRALVAASGLPLPGLRALAELAAERYVRHSDANVPKKQASDLYRKVRERLAASAASGDDGREQSDALRAVLAEARSAKMHRPFEDWLIDCLHVHSIRLLTTWHPISHLETTCYHVLHKMLGTEVALSKSAE